MDSLHRPFASTISAPCTADILLEFQSSNSTLGAFVTSAYLLGYVAGPLAVAPLSELYGRVIVYNVCNALVLLFSIACALSPNLSALLVFRVLSGLAASCPLTIGAGTIADMIPLQKRGLAMSFWVLGPIIGPTIAPIGMQYSREPLKNKVLTRVVGTYLSHAKGWRWVFWLVSIIVGFPKYASG